MTDEINWSCEACNGDVLSGMSCYACGRKGPIGNGEKLAALDEAAKEGVAEVLIEQAFWDFDEQSKRTGQQRTTFKDIVRAVVHRLATHEETKQFLGGVADYLKLIKLEGRDVVYVRFPAATAPSQLEAAKKFLHDKIGVTGATVIVVAGDIFVDHYPPRTVHTFLRHLCNRFNITITTADGAVISPESAETQQEEKQDGSR